MTKIRDQDIDDLTAAIDQLLVDIPRAIQHYQPHPTDPAPPDWNTPQPWLVAALPNLENHRRNWLDALRDHRIAANPAALISAANRFSGLGKKMDFSTGWMRQDDRQKVAQSIERLSATAYRIYTSQAN